MKRKSLAEKKVSPRSVFYFHCAECQATLSMSLAEVKKIIVFICADCSASDCPRKAKKDFIIVCPECRKDSLQFEAQKRFDDFICKRRVTAPAMGDLNRMREAIQLLVK